MAKGFFTLRGEAVKAAKVRGHKLSWEVLDLRPNTLATRAIGTCKVCGEWVQIDATPAPNGIDIGGPAVAMQCTTAVNERTVLSVDGKPVED